MNRVYNPRIKKVLVSRDVVFNEKTLEEFLKKRKQLGWIPKSSMEPPIRMKKTYKKYT